MGNHYTVERLKTSHDVDDDKKIHNKTSNTKQVTAYSYEAQDSPCVMDSPVFMNESKRRHNDPLQSMMIEMRHLFTKICLGEADAVSKILTQNEVIADNLDCCRSCYIAGEKMKLSPLHLAAACGHNELVRILLSHAPFIANIQDEKKGQTALHFAVQLCHLEVVEELCDSDAVNMNAQNFEGKTALHIAIEIGSVRAVEMILRRPDVDIIIADQLGNTALHELAYYPNTDIMNRLLHHARSMTDLVPTSPYSPALLNTAESSQTAYYQNKTTLDDSVEKEYFPTVLSNEKKSSKDRIIVMSPPRPSYQLRKIASTITTMRDFIDVKNKSNLTAKEVLHQNLRQKNISEYMYDATIACIAVITRYTPNKYVSQSSFRAHTTEKLGDSIQKYNISGPFKTSDVMSPLECPSLDICSLKELRWPIKSQDGTISVSYKNGNGKVNGMGLLADDSSHSDLSGYESSYDNTKRKISKNYSEFSIALVEDDENDDSYIYTRVQRPSSIGTATSSCSWEDPPYKELPEDGVSKISPSPYHSIIA